jgi:hypothetical protein
VKWSGIRDSAGKQTPRLLDEALSWHTRYLADATMRDDAAPVAA